MRVWGKFLLATLLLSSFVSLVSGYKATAISLSEPFQLAVPSSTVTVQGKASPFALVTVQEGGNTIATTVANNLGYFSKVVNRNPGLHKLKIYYDDNTNIRSSTTTKSISVGPQQNSLANVFLSPTISRSTSLQTTSGGIVQIRGYTYAGSAVTLSLDYGAKILTTSASQNGFYEFLINSSPLSFGSHVAATTSAIGIEQSTSSSQVSFIILNKATTPRSSSLQSIDITVGRDELPPPTPSFPEDNSVIDGQKVEITGEAKPGAQINIYQNGDLYGSVFADETGTWKFIFIPNFSPVTLSFEQCINEKCSALSKTLTLTFPNLEKSCQAYIKLGGYRFWGLRKGQTTALEVVSSSGSGIIEIDWGDGDLEKFNFENQVPIKYDKSYTQKGQYNGKLFFTPNGYSEDDNCKIEKLFSVNVSDSESSKSFWWLLIAVPTLFVISRYILKRLSQGRNKS